MTPERGQRVYADFEAALNCDAAGRAALLDELCAGDPELRAEVERLLAQDAEAAQDRFLATQTSTDRDALRRDKSTDGKTESYWARSLGGTSAETPPLASTLPPGLADHPDYEITRELGRGGMGVVYLAQNTLMGRTEVLKVVGSHLINHRGVLDRFLAEIRSAARLHHANIVTAYSVLRIGESLVLAMEFVEGLDLAKLVLAKGPLPVAHACNYAHQAAMGLQHAHENGMVHRDIKPSNLMLTRQNDRALIKILDFGLAKVHSEGAVDAGLTLEGQMLGTPAYVAPEQISDARRADIRADIYSLGCTLYYLLTGKPPFDGESLYDILQAHYSMEATPLNLARPQVPVELAAVVAKMMAKQPDRRFQQPKEVAQALTPFFKKGSVASAGSKPELSQAGQTNAKQTTARVGSVPTRLAAKSAPSPGPRYSTTAQRSRPEPIRESLVDLVETESSRDAAPAVTETRRQKPRWMWPAAAGSVILLGLAVAWAAGTLNVKPKNGVLVLENVPENCVVRVDGKKTIVAHFGGGPVKIEAGPGNHDVLVMRGDNVLLVKRVTLKSGKAFKLTVPRASEVRAKDAMLVLENVPSNAVVEVDGDRVAPSPTAGGPFEVKIQPGRHVVVIKQGNDVLLADSVNLEPGKPFKLTVRKVMAMGAGIVLENVPANAVAEIDGNRVPAAPAAGSSVDPAPARQPSDKPASPPKRPELVRIEGDEFLMGSPDDDLPEDEKPQRKVWIRPFHLSRTEVTQEQYQTVMGTNPSHFSSTGPGRRQVEGRPTEQHPVENVSWFGAILFCNAVSRQDGLAPYYQIENNRVGDDVERASDVRIPVATGTGYRLPTEAEWEWACRAKTTTRYAFGDDASKLAIFAWFDENSEGMTHPVGEKRANDWGLFDMHGNVAEWCWDGYADYEPDAVDNPQGPTDARERVVRGGSWLIDAESCRPAIRGSKKPTAREHRLGFRVAKY